MDERNKFSKRIKRYADLCSSAGILALKYASTKLLKNKDLKNAETLSNMLG